MPFTVYTGKDMTVVHGAVTLDKIKKVEINDKARPTAEQLDKTTALSSAYEYMADPLGSKGDASASVTVTCEDSQTGYAENKIVKTAMGAEASLVFSAGAAGSDKYTCTMALNKRTTTITHDGFAEMTLTFDAKTNGTWDTV